MVHVLAPSDFVHLPYTPDLTQAGILYSCRSLALDLIQASNLRLEPLRQQIADTAAEVAFHRLLSEHHLPFKTIPAARFSQPDRFEVMLGGRRCHLVNSLIAHSSSLRRLESEPEYLLSAPARIPEMELTSERMNYQDLLIFAFTLALTRPGWDEIRQSQNTQPSLQLIYIFPKIWRNPTRSQTIGPLTFLNESDEEITLDLGGSGMDHKYLSKKLRLFPRKRTVIIEDFATLAYLSTQQVPTGKISVHSERTHRSLQIPRHRWANLWLDGVEIILAGYAEIGEFRRQARHLHSINHAWEDLSTPSPAVFLPLVDLHPLLELLAWMKALGT